ncbi:hypothetical protein D9M71_485090 [compost metagenome]
MARRAELAVDAGGGELAQQVFVDIALHVALSQRQGMNHLHGGGQHRLVLDLQIGVLHVLADMAEAFTPTTLALGTAALGEEGIDVLLEMLVQLLAAHVVEVLPAQPLAFRGIGEQAVECFAGAVGFALGHVFLHVEHAGEHQVADLLDHGQRVGDAASPEFFPELVDIVADFAGEHSVVSIYRLCGHQAGVPGWSGFFKKGLSTATNSVTSAGANTPSMPSWEMLENGAS